MSRPHLVGQILTGAVTDGRGRVFQLSPEAFVVYIETDTKTGSARGYVRKC